MNTTTEAEVDRLMSLANDLISRLRAAEADAGRTVTDLQNSPADLIKSALNATLDRLDELTTEGAST